MKTLFQMMIILAVLAGTAVKAQASVKLDRSLIIYNKCMEIERLSKKHSAMKCMDRFLDRMDVQVSEIETRLMSCGERRRIEDLDNGEHIRRVVNAEMTKLRALQADAIEENVSQLHAAGEKVGPRKMKEVELRAAEQHAVRAKKLAKLVCSRPAFAAFLRKH